MPAEFSDDREPADPQPPRLRWTKRLSLLGAIFAALYVTAFLLWRHEAHRRLEREIDALHARGEPILMEDFKEEKISDADNAAMSYMAAANAVATMPTTQLDFADNLELELFYPLEPTSRAQLAQIAIAARPAMALTHAARDQSHADWRANVIQWNFSYVATLLSPQRQLIVLEGAVAAHEHLNQSDSAAIEIVKDMIRHGNAIGDLYPSILGILFSSSTHTEAFRMIQYLAGDLNIDPKHGGTTQASTPASRDQVAALIKELLDETTFQKQLEMNLQGERAWTASIIRNEPFSMIRQASPSGRLFWQPNFDLEAANSIRYLNSVIAADRTNYQRAIATTPTNPRLHVRKTGTPATVVLRLGSDYSFDPGAFYRSIYQKLTLRRVAALALAVRLYQIDHNNDFPRSLSELVPNYLPKVPSDPFAADNRPLGYRLSPRPVVYSVGIDGVDDGGNWQVPAGRSEPDPLIPPGHPFDWIAIDRKDIPYLLGDLRLAARPKSSAMSVDEVDTFNPTSNPSTQPTELDLQIR